MAINLPDPGNGIPEQKTGNDEWTNMQIVRENFADQSNAASKTIGVGKGQVSLNDNLFKALHGAATIWEVVRADADANTLVAGDRVYYPSSALNSPISPGAIVETFARYSPNRKYQISYSGSSSDAHSSFYYRFGGDKGTWSDWSKIYSTGNTTKDTATGFLKASSPVLHVYNDSITKIHEAEQLDITVDKKGVGHYEIHGTTGLRKNDGWFMSPPRDVHGNVLCMVDLDEKDGVVILKTYKKKFDFETVSIVHDWDNPMDIPEGVCVEFRFNDLPEEQLDEPTI